MPGRYDALVRRFCLAALAVEAAVLMNRYSGDLFALRLESEDSHRLVPAGEDDGSFGEEIFGFRLRIRDGAIEFYRQEESVGRDEPES